MAQLTKFQEELLNQSNETLNIYANSMQKSISGLLDDSRLKSLESIASDMTMLWIIVAIAMVLCMIVLCIMLFVTFKFYQNYRLAHSSFIKEHLNQEYQMIRDAAIKYIGAIEQRQEVILEHLQNTQENTDHINASIYALMVLQEDIQRSLSKCRESEKHLHRQLMTEKQKNIKNKTNSNVHKNTYFTKN